MYRCWETGAILDPIFSTCDPKITPTEASYKLEPVTLFAHRDELYLRWKFQRGLLRRSLEVSEREGGPLKAEKSICEWISKTEKPFWRGSRFCWFCFSV